MFIRFDKFDGPLFGGLTYGGAYIRDIDWVTYLRGIFRGGRERGVLKGF